MSRNLSDIIKDCEKTGDCSLIEEYRLERNEVYSRAINHLWVRETLRSLGLVVIRTPTTADDLEEDLQRTWKFITKRGGKNGNV